ncbi:DUF6438 domain-containing protein [Arenibacter sp. F20364]|jgi:hypothetical protein|uniref:DUF6438 domain-containing protein n=1 Tax=Arenibacter sp. F20364 TaxID=2926415 RepID=UPI001FF6BE4F|nr:DUF6438 domain-containing protein [Arenibacter sp. F20364]MCK0192996.1 DUF6438 domain-containing protein [Arenibacter sp. F20364]
MKNSIIISILFSVAIFTSCNSTSKDNVKEKFQKEKLIGEWKRIENKGENFIFHNPIGIGFSNDSIEFLHGMYKSYLDTNINKKRIKYFGNSTSFKITNDSILFKNPPSYSWRFFKSIIKIKQDTLYVLGSDSIIEKFEKLKYDLDNKITFDKILFTRSGCYGTCPKLNISINKNGDIYFNGIRYTDSIGIYKGKLNKLRTDKVFKKFQKANITNIASYYAVNHTDDEIIRTSFYAKDSLLKTIVDYGRAGPAELTWAYVSISNCYKNAELTKTSTNDSSYLKHEELFEILNEHEMRLTD